MSCVTKNAKLLTMYTQTTYMYMYLQPLLPGQAQSLDYMYTKGIFNYTYDVILIEKGGTAFSMTPTNQIRGF